jgi:hypothetical protein
MRDLDMHLQSHPESRIEAAVLFCRYMFRVGHAMPDVDPNETLYIALARARITWDIALGCLAIACKVRLALAEFQRNNKGVQAQSRLSSTQLSNSQQSICDDCQT